MHDLVISNGTIVDGTGADRFVGSVAIDGDTIVDVGADVGPARRTIDADGRLITPGFVDAHTHYDGQATWDPDLAPSSWHGVTTVVMGNCGVGFAPVRPGERDFLIRMMEGVEEIPGAALAEGMSWDWQSFPEYLDSLDADERAIDIVAQVPHCALRAYVMGPERADDDEATPDDIAEMARLTEGALRAGALGFSTSRTMLHRVKGGDVVPGTHCNPDELVGIAGALGRVGHGVFQMISDQMGNDPDYPWMTEIARITGRPLVFSLVQSRQAPDSFHATLDRLDASFRDDGLDIRASAGWRPPGVLMGLQATLNPFLLHPTFATLAHLPFDDLVAQLRRPEIRAQLLAEDAVDRGPFLRHVFVDWSNHFPLGDPPDYEPSAADSIEARAAAAGCTPAEFAYDTLLQNDGRQLVYYPLSYPEQNFDALHDMLTHPRSTASLSDGGAHVGTVCDASFTTYMLTHWARDRSRGQTIPLEHVIRKQTSETAHLYQLDDRGVIAPGQRADVNLIDFDALHLHAPYMAFDLPGGSKRLLQRADGYVATVAGGEVIAEEGELTGARPGRLVRGPQSSDRSR